MKTIPAASYTYHEVGISTETPTDIILVKLCQFFLCRGFKEGQLAVFRSKRKAKICVYAHSLKQVRELRADYRHVREKGCRFSVKTLKRKDWFDKWKRDYHISPLGSTFVIVPCWEKGEFKPGRRTPIFIDPHGAFGSGTHETTRLVVCLMEARKGRFESCFDLGTGTGILLIAARRLGGEDLRGIEIEALSVEAARDNLKKNKIQGAKVRRQDLAQLKERKQYDLVTANLISRILLENKKKIISLVGRGKYLIVSGIVLENFRDFHKKFKSSSLRCRKILKGKKWAAALYLKC